MATKSKKKPSPADLLAEVKGQKPAKTYEFDDYIEVVDELHRKDYSYADIAKFLAERLGISVTRGQVYRAHNLWLEDKEAQAEAEAEAQRFADEEGTEPPETMDEGAVAMNRAAGAVLKFLLGEYPDGSLPESHAEVLKLAMTFLDEDARNEYLAAEEDKRLALQKKEADDHSTNKQS